MLTTTDSLSNSRIPLIISSKHKTLSFLSVSNKRSFPRWYVHVRIVRFRTCTHAIVPNCHPRCPRFGRPAMLMRTVWRYIECCWVCSSVTYTIEKTHQTMIHAQCLFCDASSTSSRKQKSKTSNIFHSFQSNETMIFGVAREHKVITITSIMFV